MVRLVAKSLTASSLVLVCSGALQAYSPNPDLRESGAIAALKADPNASPVYGRTYNLGPTGLRGWIYIDRANKGAVGLMTDQSRQILVTHVGAGTPAVGVLEVDDVILGVGWGTGGAPVPSFGSDCRKRFGEAIGEAEKAENAGVLKLKRWRAGVTADVQITLPVMGTYTATAPYGCPKSALILANAIPILEAETLTGDWKGAVSALALLSTGDPAHVPAVQTLARSLADGSSALQTGRGLSTWNAGYQAVVLAEYYLATGDAYVLPGIHNYTRALARSQSLYGTFGHKGAMARSDGGFNGSIPWYGPVNSAGLVANLGIVLGKKAIVASGGVVDPEIDPAIERAANFFASYVNRGGIPYGEHEPFVFHADNGKSGMASVMFALMGDQPVQTEFFARMCISSHVGEEYGHTGQGFSYLWTALGAAAGGEEAGAAFLGEVRWHRDLARRSDGSFAYDGAEQYGGSSVADYWAASSYHGLSPTATFVLQLTLPLRQLCIGGKGADPEAPLLAPAAVANAVWAGRFSQEAGGYSTGDLIDALGEYDPVVRDAAAKELGARGGEHGTLRPQLVVMAEDPAAANRREAACHALGYMGGSSAIAALGRRLTDPDPIVRMRAADALGRLGSEALPELNTMLTAFVANAVEPGTIDWDDPLEIANSYLAKTLFNTQPFRSGIRNQPPELFHAAVRAGLEHPDGRARGHLSNLIKQDLDWADMQAVAPSLVEAVAERSPADQMFSDGIRYAGLEALAKFKVEEGIPLCLLVKEQAWHSDQWKPFQLLRDTYGTAAAEVLPTLYDWQDHLPAFDADGSISQTRYDNIEAYITSTIATLEAGTPAPALSYFKTVTIASATQLNATQVELTAEASDLDGGVPRYVWSRVSGPGAVSFSPNGTPASATTVATFDTPGIHVVRVAVADSSILDGGLWSNSALGYVDFGTYENDYGVAHADESVVISPGANWPPVAYAQEVVTGIDAPRTLALVGFDYDGDGLSYAVVTPPAHGTLSGTAPDLTYTPAPGYAGSDAFTFEVTDSRGLTSAAATVSLEVRNPLEVHVNMYASSGGNQSPQNPATLEGPAGGLGETWNQFNTTSGGGLLDSAGTATGVGFTNNVGSGWAWGSPGLSALQAGRAHFGKGTDTAHTITGLTPLSRYDLWIASYAHNSSLGERALGEWSTPNPTTTAGPRMIDSRSTGLNGSTWEQGVNYVRFDDVEADADGEILLLGDATDADELGAGEPAYRLPLSAFQIVELPPVAPAPPGGLVAAPGDTQVALNWNPVPGATGYLVKRAGTPGGPYVTRANPATTHFLDAPAANGATWFYVVSAVDAYGEGPDSVEVSATPQGLVPPPAPAGLQATPGDALVELSWDASATATSYKVKRGIHPGGPYATVASPATTSYQDQAVLNGMTWYYVISAVNSAGEGGESEEAAALPQAVTRVINVSFEQYTPSLGTPEVESTLEGPAGGLGTEWNQFADEDSAGSLVDSTGASTSVAFTTDFSEGRSGGSGNSPILRSTLTDFGRGLQRTLTITGLEANGLYDVWLTSFRDSSSARERTVGVWSTSHPTISPASQIIDNRPGRNGTTFVDGYNYIEFGKVRANGAGQIVFDGNGADTGEGFDDDYRLGLSGFQLREYGSASPSPFRVWAADPVHGLTIGVNDGPLDDPEGDGLANLLEFVLGGHPMEHSGLVLPSANPGAGGWVFEYDRSDLSVPPATVQVLEYGSDLLGWIEIPIPTTGAGPVTVTPGDPADRVRVALPDLGPTGFARLKVTE